MRVEALRPVRLSIEEIDAIEESSLDVDFYTNESPVSRGFNNHAFLPLSLLMDRITVTNAVIQLLEIHDPYHSPDKPRSTTELEPFSYVPRPVRCIIISDSGQSYRSVSRFGIALALQKAKSRGKNWVDENWVLLDNVNLKQHLDFSELTIYEFDDSYPETNLSVGFYRHYNTQTKQTEFRPDTLRPLHVIFNRSILFELRPNINDNTLGDVLQRVNFGVNNSPKTITVIDSNGVEISTNTPIGFVCNPPRLYIQSRATPEPEPVLLYAFSRYRSITTD